jgi:hypothetical protein
MSVRSAMYALALVFAGALLLIVGGFGAIVALAYRNRRPGFSYFACGDDNATPLQPAAAMTHRQHHNCGN